MKKLKLIVSDFHLGRGRILPNGTLNYLEDFFYDDRFIEFLKYHTEGDFEGAEIELIINGDFFNHLQVDIHDPTPDIIDEQAALLRTRQILQGHPDLFEALRRFIAHPLRSLTFNLGNHDPGLLFPAVHRLLKEALGDKVRVLIDPYVFDGVHVEHGNQYFADNAYNRRRYFLSKDLPAPVINLPWGSYFVIHYINKVKKERPYFDKIYPLKFYFRWALIHDTMFAVRSIAKIIFYFISLRFRRDPHRRSSFLRTLQILKQVTVSPRLHLEAKKLLLSERDIHIVVFGHSHHAVIRQYAPGKTYINSGLWNEQLSLDISNMGRLVRLTYAQLDYVENGKIVPSLKQWKGAHHMVDEIYE